MFFSRKKKTQQTEPSICPEPVSPEPPRLSKDISRALTCLKPTLFSLYREIKDQDGTDEVLKDFDERIKLIGTWTERRAAEDQKIIEVTVRSWHDQDLKYGEIFPDFSGRFNHLRRLYPPIIPADEIVTTQTTTVNA